MYTQTHANTCTNWKKNVGTRTNVQLLWVRNQVLTDWQLTCRQHSDNHRNGNSIQSVTRTRVFANCLLILLLSVDVYLGMYVGVCVCICISALVLLKLKRERESCVVCLLQEAHKRTNFNGNLTRNRIRLHTAQTIDFFRLY